MISFAKVTKSDYNTLTPVTDRLYLIEDTGEQFLNGKAYNGATDGTRDWLCLIALEANSRFGIDKKNYPTFTPSWEYSFDGVTWTPYTWYDADGGIWGTVIWLANIGDKVYLRGDNNVPTCVYENDTEKYYQFSMVGSIAVSGNIMSLLDKTCQRKDIPQNSRGFAHLFSGCPITTPPILPATTLSNYCYDNMFYQCASLEVAPELPATTLANYCYNAMFSGCTSLRVAPALPAMIMTEGCYQAMFNGCTALSRCPELPAVNLEAYCYSNMFYGCTGLYGTMATLPATNGRNYCYQQMFENCTSIRTTPKIYMVTPREGGLQRMFKGCTSLRTACDLEIEDISSRKYVCREMFSGCNKLVRGPERLLPLTVAESAYESMFEGCTKLLNAPVIYATTISGNYVFKKMFYNCSKLRKIRVLFTDWGTSYTNVFADWVTGVSNEGSFECRSSLDYSSTNIPAYFVKTTIKQTEASYAPTGEMEYENGTTYPICPSSECYYYVLATGSNRTINAVTYSVKYPTDNIGFVGTAYVKIMLGSGYTVTAGSNITFVDTLTPDKVNNCLVKWDLGVAKLYVVDTEDIPA